MWGVNIQIELNIYNIHKHNTLAVNIKKLHKAEKRKSKQTTFNLARHLYVHNVQNCVFLNICIIV